MQPDELENKAVHAQDAFLGTTLADKYEILSLLGGGGAGQVYKARHLFIKQTVAIKVLFPHMAMSESKVQRFKQEALAISHLNHPGIVGVIDFGQAANGQPYLVMEYVEGKNLADLLKHEGPLPLQRAIPLLIQACDALAHAHSKGLIHRDLKPGNMMLMSVNDDKELLKIIDFGLAKQFTEGEEGFLQLTQTGEVFGSPLYMSPEQITGQKADNRTDIYTMGIVIYELLTGKPPFNSSDPVEIFTAHVNQDPGSLTNLAAPRHIREYLEVVILTAMAKDPSKRFQSMDNLKEALEYVSQAPQGLAHTGTLWKLLTARFKRQLASSSRPAWIAVAALAVLTGLALIVTLAVELSLLFQK